MSSHERTLLCKSAQLVGKTHIITVACRKWRQAMTDKLLQALSRLAGNRHTDGVSSLVGHEDQTAVINKCHD